jgi:hypothetical protein
MDASANPRSGRDETMITAGRNLAQMFCLVTGAVLLIVGILGFTSDASFDAGSNVQGDEFLGFEVNGWHNLVHIATGAFLLAVAGNAATAISGALIFGALYVVVFIWGLIDDTVLWLVPINGADNVLHLILALAAIAAALAARSMIRNGERR